MNQTLSSFELAAMVANLVEDKKAKDILILQTQQITSLADYFVIASVESRSQMQAIADHIIKVLKALHLKPLGQEIDKSGRWTLLDFGDIVIHLLHKDERDFYQLERFWNHATEVPEELWLKDKRQAS